MPETCQFSGLVFPLDRDNVDTDQIIPKQFLKKIDRQGFGKFLFYHWRFNDDGTIKEDFLLNDKKYEGASVLVGGKNFGCGSSREHAPWSLLDFGFRVVIAPSFADIFYNNCLKNGILPIRLEHSDIEALQEKAARSHYKLSVNLEEQFVSDEEGFYSKFIFDPYWKQMLMNGWDEISITLAHEDEIKQYESLR
ncbi:3-isopropylmalate dehydratase small subunit [Alkalihalobacillus sp. AL-G]|uniref:3-isopropylmalate dehydratase small subunit n=1 Tax=Alkalihalobacillus sp. AL-G TaxID=2926399 RepID=UPI00272B5C69|nr:3-isopropylmalate dehydratase small subunit [Alkalihalobacillus sp. AL-G]WLD93684.1 3-isopropylmalate dehydratase small subunit [Alkalihalobacillus sp. AL-G]